MASGNPVPRERAHGTSLGVRVPCAVSSAAKRLSGRQRRP